MKCVLPLLAACLLALAANPTITHAAAALQFRWVTDNPAADSEQMTAVQPAGAAYKPEVLNVEKEVLLDSSDVKIVSVKVDNRGNPTIDIKLTDDGAKRFGEMTRQNIGRRLAIVIDGKLNSAPRIASAITGGRAEIAGHFTQQEAENLAARISGSSVQVHKAVNWSRIGFYSFALLFTAATCIIVWIAIRRKDVSSAA